MASVIMAIALGAFVGVGILFITRDMSKVIADSLVIIIGVVFFVKLLVDYLSNPIF